jgi:hypothetical protein
MSPLAFSLLLYLTIGIVLNIALLVLFNYVESQIEKDTENGQAYKKSYEYFIRQADNMHLSPSQAIALVCILLWPLFIWEFAKGTKS